MLTKLSLANFRAFDEAVTVRFRPITVLIGPNGSGKSTIINFLLMLQQSQEPSKDELFSPEGDLVNLGSFLEQRNALTRKRNLQFALTMTSPPGENSPFARAAEQIIYEVEGIVPYGGNRGKGNLNYAADAATDGETLLQLGFRVGDNFQFGDYPRAQGVLEEILEYDERGRPPEEIAESIDEHKALLQGVMVQHELIQSVHYEVGAPRHLGTNRAAPPRVILAAPPPLDSVGRNGEHTLLHLQRMVAEKGERYYFLLPWLQGIAGIADLEFKDLGRPGQITQAFARNPANGARVNLADYGLGCRQSLPILAQGAIMPPYTTLMVEQPEAQLHPAAQREMGSYFADLWRQRQVGSIIETHSANLLLRLRRMVALEELSPQDISVAYFSFDENNRGKPSVKNLDLNPDGSIAAGLPADFFGAEVAD